MEGKWQQKSNEKYTVFYIAFQVLRVLLKKNVRYSHQIFYFLLFYMILAFTLADIMFHKFLELHSTLSKKKIFITMFPFLTDPGPP